MQPRRRHHHPRASLLIVTAALAVCAVATAARAQESPDPTFKQNAATPSGPLQEQARTLYHRVVEKYKEKEKIKSPDAQWWYELAKAYGLLAYRDSHSLPEAITQFENLLKQKPDAEEAKEGLRLAESLLGVEK